MKYNLIFYLAKKTSYCERALKKKLSTIDGEVHQITSAITPTALGEEVVHSLKICPLTVIIGGLSSNDDDNLATVLSRVFSNSSLSLDNMRKLSSVGGTNEGYIIRCKNQILLALPDNPADAEAMCSEELLNYIKEKLQEKTKES